VVCIPRRMLASKSNDAQADHPATSGRRLRAAADDTTGDNGPSGWAQEWARDP